MNSKQTFREDVVFLRDDGKNQYPDHFDNEIYYSKNCDFISYEPGELSYRSNVSLKYVYSGHETYLINGIKKEVRPDQVLFVNNLSDVTLLSSEGNSTSIFLDRELVNECYGSYVKPSGEHKYGLSSGPSFFEDTTPNVGFGFETLKNSIDRNPDLIIPVDYYYELANCLLASQFEINNEIDRISKQKASTRIEIYRKINIAKCYLNDTLEFKFDFDTLAREATMSKFQLLRHFKEVVGQTPHRYFIIKKLKKADSLLRNSKMLIKEIAYHLGYPDSTSFGKQFRQIYGISPAEVRSR